ncbi:hypothetical protein AALP_AAs44920U000400 [Arabis alpina]|uniref:Uncharacterized protein n=1 Tax=Arabis alpina TaxID=50452 RepID=A0A087FZL4_ARAAL|nr:hypothetical protein AALP_AAs44920U000400 [Arabis alpina]
MSLDLWFMEVESGDAGDIYGGGSGSFGGGGFGWVGFDKPRRRADIVVGSGSSGIGPFVKIFCTTGVVLQRCDGCTSGFKSKETWIDQKSNLAASAMEDGIVLKPIGYGGEEMDCWNGGSLSLIAEVKLVVQIREDLVADQVADPVDLAIPAVVEVRMASREAGLVALEGDQSRPRSTGELVLRLITGDVPMVRSMFSDYTSGGAGGTSHGEAVTVGEGGGSLGCGPEREY